jgi:hypothetical protein
VGGGAAATTLGGASAAGLGIAAGGALAIGTAVGTTDQDDDVSPF